MSEEENLLEGPRDRITSHTVRKDLNGKVVSIVQETREARLGSWDSEGARGNVFYYGRGQGAQRRFGERPWRLIKNPTLISGPEEGLDIDYDETREVWKVLGVPHDERRGLAINSVTSRTTGRVYYRKREQPK